jgi:ribosomal protein L16 Arg81 hydroxylase
LVQAGRTLSPGDMLYLPPKVAHHGVALEKGLTYSVGFLAPKRLVRVQLINVHSFNLFKNQLFF